MNLNQIINMLVRLFMHKVVNKGIDLMATRGKPRDEITIDEREQAKSTKKHAGKARDLMRFLRRFGRF